MKPSCETADNKKKSFQKKSVLRFEFVHHHNGKI